MEMTETPEAKALSSKDVDGKANNEEPKSNQNYFYELLKDSVVTGVPQIVTTSSLFRKALKILILGACIGGFIYQVVAFVKLYRTYPSSLEIEVIYARELPPPTVTVCNRNPVQRTRFCKAKGHFCAKPTNLTKFCDVYYEYCHSNTTANDLQFVVTDLVLVDDDIVEFGQKGEDFINECCYNFINTGNECRKKMRKILHPNENGILRNCYVINFAAIEFSEDDTEDILFRMMDTCSMWNTYDFEESYSVVINLDQNENARPDTRPSAQAVIHSYNNFKNPFKKGFTLEEGKRYTVTLRAFEENLLPAPYSTNCTNNDELDDDYSREICIFNCSIKPFIESCGCLPDILSMKVPGIPNCETLSSVQCFGDAINQDTEDCFQQCPRLCKFSFFEYEVSVSNIEDSITAVDLGDGPIFKESFGENITSKLKRITNILDGEGKAILNLVYSKREVTVFNYKPKYEKIEVLGYIGGFSGIWLGISLVAIFDFFETILVFICYLLKRSKDKKINRSR